MLAQGDLKALPIILSTALGGGGCSASSCLSPPGFEVTLSTGKDRSRGIHSWGNVRGPSPDTLNSIPGEESTREEMCTMYLICNKGGGEEMGWEMVA